MQIPPPTLTNHTQSIVALLLSLKKRPVVRYEKMSGGGKKLGQEVLVRELRWHDRRLLTGGTRGRRR